MIGVSNEKDFKERSAANERESSGLRGEVNQMAKTLSLLREELKSTEKNLLKNSSESVKTITNLTNENDKLQKLINDTKLLNLNSNEKSSHEIMEMKKKIMDRENEIKNEMKSKDEAYKSASTSCLCLNSNNIIC